jgi:predicted RNA polymerase sigma factor
VPATDSAAAIEAVYRLEFPRVVAVLAAFTGDIALAEELAQDALVDALRQWPRDGTPQNPGAWLTTVGKRRAIDAFRRDRTMAAKYSQIGRSRHIPPSTGTKRHSARFRAKRLTTTVSA